MKKKMKLLTLITMMFLLAFAVPVTGSAASPKAQVKKSVNTFFRYAKSLNTAKMEKCFLHREEQKLFGDPAAFYRILRPYTKKMSWKIKSCKVRGNKAVVNLRVDYESLHVSYKNMLEDVVKYITTDFDASVNSTKRYMVKSLKKEVAKNGSEPYTYEKIKIRLKKADGKWKIMEPTEELIDVIYCGYIYALYNYLYNYMEEMEMSVDDGIGQLMKSERMN